MDRYRFAHVTIEEYFGYNPENTLKYVEQCDKEFDEIGVYFKPFLARTAIIKAAISSAAFDNNAAVRHARNWNYDVLFLRTNKRFAALAQSGKMNYHDSECKLRIMMSKQQKIRNKQRKFLESVTKHLEDLLAFP